MVILYLQKLKYINYPTVPHFCLIWYKIQNEHIIYKKGHSMVSDHEHKTLEAMLAKCIECEGM
jgi:hypothetical protein